MGSPAALGPGALGGWQQRPRKGQQLSTTWRRQPQWDRVRNRVLGCYTVTAPSVVTLLIRQARSWTPPHNHPASPGPGLVISYVCKREWG